MVPPMVPPPYCAEDDPHSRTTAAHPSARFRIAFMSGFSWRGGHKAAPFSLQDLTRARGASCHGPVKTRSFSCRRLVAKHVPGANLFPAGPAARGPQGSCDAGNECDLLN